ncbi:MAG TPA: LysE family transporter [Opitutaceae bacterium]
MWDDLQRGIFIGYTVSVPVGPVALLVMRRAMAGGRTKGMVSGLGAATVDLVCGTIAVLGIQGLTLVIQSHEHILRLVGGLFLIVFGLHTIKIATEDSNHETAKELTYFKAYWTTAALTIANPLTWVGLIFVSAAAGAGAGKLSPLHTAITGIAICAASASWWLILSASAAWLGKKTGSKILHIINVVAGCALFFVGAFQIEEIVRKKWF